MANQICDAIRFALIAGPRNDKSVLSHILQIIEKEARLGPLYNSTYR